MKLRATTRIEAEAYLAESIAGFPNRKIFDTEIQIFDSPSESIFAVGRVLGEIMMNTNLIILYHRKQLNITPSYILDNFGKKKFE